MRRFPQALERLFVFEISPSCCIFKTEIICHTSSNMASSAGDSRNTISLKGSTETVTEFFQYALSSILYQRGVYPAENFEPQKKYGITVMAVKDPKLFTYIQSVLKQFSGTSFYHLNKQLSPRPASTYMPFIHAEWLGSGTLQKVVLVITSVSSKEVLERWTFDIQTDKTIVAGTKDAQEKSEAAITQEIQAIIRQITASVTFLPLLSDTCRFSLASTSSLFSILNQTPLSIIVLYRYYRSLGIHR